MMASRTYMARLLLIVFLLTGCSGNDLHLAAKLNDVQEMEELLNAGAKIEQQYLLYGTALHTAAENGSVDAIIFLVTKGADINKKAGNSGFTPLHRTVGRWNIKAAETLLILGANPNILDDQQRSVQDIIKFYGPGELGEKAANDYLANYDKLINKYKD